MEISIESILKTCTGAQAVREEGVLQRLWSGYGSIVRYNIEGSGLGSVIVKHVSPPTGASHPRGWNTNRSHARKLRSYEVETAWYQNYASVCDVSCRVPRCLAVEISSAEIVIVLEDLDDAGYPLRRTSIDDSELESCLDWLANFHASFMGIQPKGLWDVGSYWHLETRPDELAILSKEDPELFAAAVEIDRRLNEAHFQTLIHGDAKLANFCFSEDGSSVAAVDFQYVGGGCGMKDVAYYLGSCLSEDECMARETELLDLYFEALGRALRLRDKSDDFGRIHEEWRTLYSFACADFQRFLKGWSPGHWKINSYSEQLVRQLLEELSCN